MEEITELRTETSKTFRKENGENQTIDYGEKIHYLENGEWVETTSTDTVNDRTIEFNQLPYEVAIDRESYCGELTISGDGYNIKTNVVPVYNNTDSVLNTLMESDYDTTDDTCTVEQKSGKILLGTTK